MDRPQTPVSIGRMLLPSLGALLLAGCEAQTPPQAQWSSAPRAQPAVAQAAPAGNVVNAAADRGYPLQTALGPAIRVAMATDDAGPSLGMPDADSSEPTPARVLPEAMPRPLPVEASAEAIEAPAATDEEEETDEAEAEETPTVAEEPEAPAVEAEADLPAKDELKSVAKIMPPAPKVEPKVEEFEGTPLPWDVAVVRSPEMDAICWRAAQRVSRGIFLAERGAMYSARTEFVGALQTITQALDAHGGSMAHSQALAAGLRALSESNDFIPRPDQLETDVDVRAAIAGHKTPVLKGDAANGLSPLAARQRYYTYAQEQLAVAVGKQPAGSKALYAMGKLYSVRGDVEHDPAAGPKAVVFHQAALAVDAKNYLAGNELGVILASYGRLQQAKAALMQSLVAKPQATTWRNLAIVHGRLGEAKFAQLATQEAVRAEKNPTAARSPVAVEWLDATQFAQGTSPIDQNAGRASAAKPATEATAKAEKPKKERSRFPWFMTKREKDSTGK